MMKPKSTILDDVAARKIPGDLDLTRPIFARLEKRPARMALTASPAGVVILVLLALLVLTGAAFAVYRLAGDPGLQGVQDAGLVKSINTTALPTLLNVPTEGVTPSAFPVSLSQTAHGAVLTLKWVYLDQGRLALELEHAHIPANMTLGIPVVSLAGSGPVSQGVSWSFYVTENSAEYVAYHALPQGQTAGTVDLSVDVPLVPNSGGVSQANFHFDVKGVPVYTGQSIPLQQTYSVRANGVDVRLKSITVMPSYTEVVTCYDFPISKAPFWYMASATVQIGGGAEESIRTYSYLSEITDDHCVKLGFQTGSATLGTSATGAAVQASGASNVIQLVFRVKKLVVPLSVQDVLPAERIAAANQLLAKDGIEIAPAPADQTEGPGGWKFVRKPPAGTDPSKDPTRLVADALEEKLTGPWEFTVDLPKTPDAQLAVSQAPVDPNTPTPGVSPDTGASPDTGVSPTAGATTSPAPLGTQSLNGATVTLDWVFADVRRIAVGYTINGLPDVPDATELLGNIILKDAQGHPIGTSSSGMSSAQRVEGKPGSVNGTWGMTFIVPPAPGQGTYGLDLILGEAAPSDLYANTLGYFNPPANATPYPQGFTPPKLPDHTIGTFHFDFTVPVYPQLTLQPGQTVSASGLVMTLEKVEMTPSYTGVTLCYQKPSSKDWMLAGAGAMPTLEFGGYTTNLDGYALLSDGDYGGYTGKGPRPTDLPEMANGRCVAITFLLGHSNHKGTATLTIPAMAQSIPEVFAEDELRPALEKLKAEGIDMDYVTSSSASGGGGAGPVYHALPAGMTEVEAYQQFLATLGYIQPGPWVFTFDVAP